MPIAPDLSGNGVPVSPSLANPMGGAFIRTNTLDEPFGVPQLDENGNLIGVGDGGDIGDAIAAGSAAGAQAGASTGAFAGTSAGQAAGEVAGAVSGAAAGEDAGAAAGAAAGAEVGAQIATATITAVLNGATNIDELTVPTDAAPFPLAPPTAQEHGARLSDVSVLPTVAGASRLTAAAYLNTTKKLLAYGGVPDGVTDNYQAVASALADIKTLGRGTLEFTNGDWLFVAREIVDGTYSGSGLWGKYGLAIKSMSNWRIVGMGNDSRIIRRDPALTVTDKYSGHIVVSEGSCNWQISDLTIVGQQLDNIDFGTGMGISVNRSSNNGVIRNLNFEECGAGAAICLGMNRRTGTTAQRTDRTSIVENTEISNIHVWNSRYALVTTVADGVRLNGWNHQVRSFVTPLGVTVPGYARRSVYILGSRNVQASGGLIQGVSKTSILIGMYSKDVTAAFDAERLHFSDIIIEARGGQTDTDDQSVDNGPQDGDYHAGIWIGDQNTSTDTNTLCRLKDSSFTDITIKGSKVGILYTDRYNTTGNKTIPMLSNVAFKNIRVSTTSTGIDIISKAVLDRVTFDGVDVALAANPALSTALANTGFRIGYAGAVEAAAAGGTPTEYATGCTVKSVYVRAANRPVQFLGIDGLKIDGCNFAYLADGVTTPARSEDLYFTTCKNTSLQDVTYSTLSIFYSQGRINEFGKERVAVQPDNIGAVDNVQVGLVVPAQAAFTNVIVGATSVAPVASSNGTIVGGSGIATYRNGAGYRVHYTAYNDNGAVFQVGTIGTGGALRTLTATGVSALETATGVGTVRWSGDGKLSFYGATPVVKPFVSGSRAGNAALASLLSNLAALGIITDGSAA